MNLLQSFKKPYLNLNRIEIKSDALNHNFHYYQNSLKHSLVAPVLKSNAYGHGLVMTAKWIDQNLQVPYLCVDSLFEAYQLLKAGVQTPILIIGYTFPENFRVRKKLPFTFPVFDVQTLKALNQHQPGCKIHLKIDTGMNRLGLQPEHIDDFIGELKKADRVKIEGIYTHLAQADDHKSNSYSKMQIRLFKHIIHQFHSAGFSFTYKHIAATSGSLQFESKDFNLTRLGLGFYGHSMVPTKSPLKPALKYLTHLIQVKRVGEGSQLSYDGTFTAKHPMALGILPLGYYDGLDHRLSNRGFVKVGDTICPIVGRVCMNLTIIDISKVRKPFVGQEVRVISTNLKSKNSLVSHSKSCKTIPYTLLTGLSETTKRIIV